jgi:hypothetical protein
MIAYSFLLPQALHFIIELVILIFLTTVLNSKNMQVFGWSDEFNPLKGFDYYYQHFSLNIIIMSLIGFILLRNLPSLFSTINNSLFKKILLLVAPLVFGIYLINSLIIVFFDHYFKAYNLLYFQRELVWLIIFIKIAAVFITSLIHILMSGKL